MGLKLSEIGKGKLYKYTKKSFKIQVKIYNL